MLDGSDEVMDDSNTSGSKENPEDVDLCKLEGNTEGALAFTVSFSTKDSVVQSPKPVLEGILTFESVSNKDGIVQGGYGSGDVVMEGASTSTKPAKNVGFSDGAH